VEDTLVNLKVEGMTCANCAAGVSRYLEKQGASDVFIDFSDGEAQFKLSDEAKVVELMKGIENLGYTVSAPEEEVKEEGHEQTDSSYTSLKRLFIFCGLLTLPLLLSMFFNLDLLHNPYFQLLLATPVFLAGLYYFGKSAFHSIKNRNPNMDVLITIGSSAAFFYSLYGTLNGLGEKFMFYETACTIITIVMFGNLLEKRTLKQTTSALSSLKRLMPEYVNRIEYFGSDNEYSKEIPYTDIKINDLLAVNIGDRIPVDAKVIWGTAEIDKSVITGESLPVTVKVGSDVISGSMVTEGHLKIKAETAGHGTVLARIIKMVRAAQADKPAIQKLADKVSRIFVPSVLVISLLTFIITHYGFDVSFQTSLINAIAVLVISCPCALGLATPTAVSAGLGRAAKQGMMVKGASTLEALSKVKHIVFDKTGTLTTGDFRISNIETFNISQIRLKSILLGLERYSNHPLAKSIVKRLQGTVDPVQFEDINEIKGLGIMGRSSVGDVYMAGSYACAENVTDDDTHHTYVLKNGELIGCLDLEDELKPNVEKLVSTIKEIGFKPIILSGDNKTNTERVARSLGIDTYHYDKLPSEKLKIIEALQNDAPVAMIGDGVNDAPALAKADVGISFADGTKIAADTADIVIMDQNIDKLKNLTDIAHSTVGTVKQNIFWAFAYNIVAIPIAALGFLNPMIAAISMAFSDVIVILNSVRLARKKFN